MKTLPPVLSHKEIIAVCVFICLMPFAHQNFIEALNRIALMSIVLILLLPASVIVFALLKTGIKRCLRSIIKQIRIVVVMLA